MTGFFGISYLIYLEMNIYSLEKKTLGNHQNMDHTNICVQQPLKHSAGETGQSRQRRMLFGKSISSWFVRFMILIGLLPGGKSKSLDAARLFIWIIIGALTTFGWIYVHRSLVELQLKDIIIQKLIMFISSFAAPGVQTIGTVVAFSTAWQRYPCLIREDKIPPPDAFWFFVIVILSNFWAFQPIVTTIRLKTYSNVLATIVFGITMGLFLEITMAGTFIVGVCIAQTKRNIQKKTHVKSLCEARIIGENIVKEFRCLKSFLSPLMFVHFLVGTLIVIANANMILTSKILGMVPVFCYALLTMGYICFVANSCYEEFKSVTDILR